MNDAPFIRARFQQGLSGLRKIVLPLALVLMVSMSTPPRAIAQAFVTESPRQTPVLLEADVVVIGGGLSGVGAAIGAGRAGAKTVLIEKTGFLGGWIRARDWAAGSPSADGGRP